MSLKQQQQQQQHTMMIRQTLHGVTYALRASPFQPWYMRLGKTAMSILGVPLVAVFSIIMATPLRGTILSMVIPRVMLMVDQEFKEERKTLLKEVSGTVLDVGSGGGAYLQYCQQATEVVAVEPVTKLHPIIRKSGHSLQKLTVLKSMDDLPPTQKFDWVILGNVLCEVESVKETIHKIDDILKPGGHVYFMEHIASPKGTWQRSFQDMVNPLHRFVAGGCNCNRDSLEILKTSADWDVIAWTYEHFKVMMGNFVCGLAMKKIKKDRLDQ